MGILVYQKIMPPAAQILCDFGLLFELEGRILLVCNSVEPCCIPIGFSNIWKVTIVCYKCSRLYGHIEVPFLSVLLDRINCIFIVMTWIFLVWTFWDKI